MSITVALPADNGGRYFAGPNGKMFAGTDTSGDANYAAAHTRLVAVDGTTPLLPDVTTPTDALTNTALSRLMAYLMGFDGSTWRRLRTDATYGLAVDVKRAAPALSAVVHTAVSVSTSSTVINGALATRRWLLVINDGTVPVYLKVEATAVVNQGIRLAPNGGSLEISDALGNLFTGGLRGIVASGAATVLVSEGT